MDEETLIINSNTRNEKIKNFLIKNKKLLTSLILLIIFLLIGYFVFEEYNKRQKIKISDQYNRTVAEYSETNKEKTKISLISLVNKKDSTYSPLSLFFIIDNVLVSEQSKINKLFDVIIEEVSLEKEIKNLIVYKKALYNADNSDENKLLGMLNPILNSTSVWKAHALYLMAEFFYSNNEKQKAKEFFNQIILLENANQDLIIESKKRLNRDLSE
tara:strand:- start:2125 stop:2769 length:645 start_codon:yes stop_codon:yes gene_type:complete